MSTNTALTPFEAACEGIVAAASEDRAARLAASQALQAAIQTTTMTFGRLRLYQAATRAAHRIRELRGE